MFKFFKRFYSNSQITPKICVVGSGPAGFYAAQYLLKKLKNCEINIIERLPVPFGLVRYGVAPDHPEVKNVENTFTKVAENPSVKYIGNVSLGRDISLKELLSFYHIVILAYGADKNQNLNIPGNNLSNILSAREIVGWYNGLPWNKNLPIDVNCEDVSIIGQGNVAIDIARIFLTPIDLLKKTDITEHSLEILSRSKIKRINLIGRRGPLQVAFTIKELREMIKLKSCIVTWKAEDFKGIEKLILDLPRPKKRITELMIKSLNETKLHSEAKVFSPIFLRSPLEFIGDKKISKIKLGVNVLHGSDIIHKSAKLTNDFEIINSDLAVVSIGYKSVPVDSDLEFENGIVKNLNGKIAPGLYATGWLGTGSVGVILTTMNNSFAVAENILEDLRKDSILTENKPGYDMLLNVLKEKNVQTIHWKDWLKINDFEIKNGQKAGKPREKIVDIQDMLKIAAS